MGVGGKGSGVRVRGFGLAVGVRARVMGCKVQRSSYLGRVGVRS